MCGIAGIASKNLDYEVSETQLRAMRDIMSYRGPDDAGNFIAPGIGLASRRLAILDLSPKGHMPMTTSDGRFTIVHNGEVYNFQELKRELESAGDTFRSHTDTEVLLYLFRKYGPSMLDRLNGMFAFAIWDNQEKELFLARDRVGVKPLYYSNDGQELLFGSEEKCLIAAGWPAVFDQDSLEELLCFRYRAGEQTPIKGINRLQPGHFAIWKQGQLRIKRWWNLLDKASNLRETSTFRDPEAWYEETFADSVNLRKISDVPVGVLLSGGLDSSSVAAALKRSGHTDLQSFTVGFDKLGYDESPLAEETAKHFGFKSHKVLVSQTLLQDLILEASWLSDEPIIHGNDTHILAIARYAKDYVTVLLSGEGGDETLGGYIRYQWLRYPRTLSALASKPSFSLLKRFGKGRSKKLGRFLALKSLNRFVLYNSVDLLPHELEDQGFQISEKFPYRETVLQEAASLYPNSPMRQVMYSDHHTFLESLLHRNDRMTMGASIECRVPFLDYRLIEGLMALPTEKLLPGFATKPILRRTLGRYLPTNIQRHKKWGFSVPWFHYLRVSEPFRSFLNEIPKLDIFHSMASPQKISSVIERWQNGDHSLDHLVRQLYFIGIWHETYMKKTSLMKKVA